MLVQIGRDTPVPRSVTAPSPEIKEEYEAKCQSCGLCCCVPLIKADGKAAYDRLLSYPAIHEITYRWWHGYEQTDTEQGYWMRMREGRCIALEGELKKQVTCTIYPDRPNVCRAFEAGSDACLHLREKAGIDDH